MTAAPQPGTKGSGLSAFIGRKMFGKKKMPKMAINVKQDAEDKKDGGKDEATETQQKPSGIAVGNPKKVSAKKAFGFVR